MLALEAQPGSRRVTIIGVSSGKLLSPRSRSRRPPEMRAPGGSEFLVHPFDLLGRTRADRIAGLRGVDPKL